MQNGDRIFLGDQWGHVMVTRDTRMDDGTRYRDAVVRWDDAKVGIYPVAATRWRRSRRAWELLLKEETPMITACAFREDTGNQVAVAIVCNHCGTIIKPDPCIFQSGWMKVGWTSPSGEKFVRYTCPDCSWKESQR